MAIIVSLTSYKERLPTLHLCLESLLTQRYKPSKIVLYLHENEVVDKNITSLQQKGIEIKYFTEDYKPHNKYLHAMREYPNDVIVTFDDDALYPPHLLELLVSVHKKFPCAVIAGRGHEIRLNKQGYLLPYKEWGWETTLYYEIPSMGVMATGVGGVLYPPNSMSSELFNTVNISKLCLYADDIWLKCMQVLKGTPVVIVPQSQQHPPNITNVAKNGLCLINVFQKRNDQYLKSVTEQYNINWKKNSKI